MKLVLLLFATVALANPLANPLPDEPAAAPVPDDLAARQASCTVTGVDSRQNVCCFPSQVRATLILHKGPGTCRANTYSSCHYLSVPGFCPNSM